MIAFDFELKINCEQAALMQNEGQVDLAPVAEEPKGKGKKGSATTKPPSAAKAKSPKGAKGALPPIPSKLEETFNEEENNKTLVKEKIKKEYLAALKKEGFFVCLFFV